MIDIDAWIREHKFTSSSANNGAQVIPEKAVRSLLAALQPANPDAGDRAQGGGLVCVCDMPKCAQADHPPCDHYRKTRKMHSQGSVSCGKCGHDKECHTAPTLQPEPALSAPMELLHCLADIVREKSLHGQVVDGTMQARKLLEKHGYQFPDLAEPALSKGDDARLEELPDIGRTIQSLRTMAESYRVFRSQDLLDAIKLIESLRAYVATLSKPDDGVPIPLHTYPDEDDDSIDSIADRRRASTQPNAEAKPDAGVA